MFFDLLFDYMAVLFYAKIFVSPLMLFLKLLIFKYCGLVGFMVGEIC